MEPHLITRPNSMSNHHKNRNAKSSRIDQFDFCITIVPILGFTVILLATQLAKTSPLILIIFILLVSLFQCRLLLVIHELGHNTMSSGKSLMILSKLLAATLTLVPVEFNKQAHAVHHQYNGNWCIYKGPLHIVEVDSFRSLTTKQQWIYRLTRRIELIWITAAVQNLILPRWRLLQKIFPAIRSSEAVTPDGNLWLSIFKASDNLAVKRSEFIDTLFVTTCGFSWMLYLLKTNLLVALAYSISILLALSFVTIIFHVNHTFPGSYATTTGSLSQQKVIEMGTSNIKWHPVLHWFTLNFGFHQVHHAFPSIHWRDLPGFVLRTYSPSPMTDIRISDFPKCFDYLLWSSQRETFLTLSEANSPT